MNSSDLINLQVSLNVGIVTICEKWREVTYLRPTSRILYCIDIVLGRDSSGLNCS